MENLKWDFDIESGKVVAKHVGRLMVGPFTVRMILLPDGIHLMIPKEAVEDGFVHVSDRYSDKNLGTFVESVRG